MYMIISSGHGIHIFKEGIFNDYLFVFVNFTTSGMEKDEDVQYW